MNIIIPMTGMGRRFVEAGYRDPKPLIHIDGRPMIEYVLDMFPGEHRILFLCHADHLKTTPLRSVLTRAAPHGKIFEIAKTTWDGPVPDILQVAPEINDAEPVLVSYCDFTVSWDFQKFTRTVQEKNYDGAIIAYRGFHPHHLGPTYYGYMRVDEQNMLLEIKEKESFTAHRQSEFAAAGSYYFKSGAMMKQYFREAVSRDLRTGNEFYVSLPYNLMARDGLKTYVYEVPRFIQFGTPEDVQAYEYWLSYFRGKKLL